MAEHLITFLPAGQTISVTEGTNLLDAARSAGLTPNAPCGGKGTCGKCKVRLLHLPDAPETLACQTPVTGPMTVRFLSDEGKSQVISTKSDLSLGAFPADSDEGYCVAFDIGTTTVVGYLLDANGRELGSIGRLNPQMTYGADVISRINYCLENTQEPLTSVIRKTLREQILYLCDKQGISDEEIRTVADALRHLGDPSRLRIFWLLCHTEECVADIAEYAEMSSPAVSHHLRLLKTAGLITSRRDGKEMLYKAAETELASELHHIIERIAEVSCPG